ncbi:TPA: OmpA family protein [Serratia marcescens]
MRITKLVMVSFFSALLVSCSGYRDVEHKWCNQEPKKSSADDIQAQTVTLILDSDTTFAFDGSQMDDILPEGRRNLDVLAAEVKGKESKISRIDVVGHADRLGGAEYNYELGLQRANTIKKYLIRSNVLNKIDIASMGSSKPVLDCRIEKGEELKKCLQPNRRVDIQIHLKE